MADTTDGREPSCWKIMGYKDHAEFLRKARARTYFMTRICQMRAKAQQPTPEILNRVVDL